jgi:hypothetical protein
MASNRTFILGATDPEMEEIKLWIEYVNGYNGYNGMFDFPPGSGDPDLQHQILFAVGPDGKRVHPASAYRAVGTNDPIKHSTVITVECKVEGINPTHKVDHHNPGDPGYGKDPQDYFRASSLGQVIEILKETWPIKIHDHDIARARMIAAADHCLGSAYMGLCPGVNPKELLKFRVAQRAKFQNRSEESILRDIEAAQEKLNLAPSWGTFGLKDMRGSVNSDPTAELPEAATSLGVGYISGPLTDGRDPTRVKYTMSGTSSQVRDFMSRASELGLSDVYGDPARGFAGGYRPIEAPDLT